MIIKSTSVYGKVAMNDNSNKSRDRGTIASMHNNMELNKRIINSFKLKDVGYTELIKHKKMIKFR